MTSGTGGIVVPAARGKAFWFLGHLFDFKLIGENTSGAYCLFDHVVAPAPHIGAPPHMHHNADELFWVFDGTFTFRLAEQTVEVTPGSVLFVPRGLLHGFSNAGTTPGRLLVFVSPAGFEKFVEEAGEPAKSRSLPLPPAGPPDLEKLIRLARKYDIEIVGPP